MGLLDDAIREHLELKRRRGADPGEVARQEDEALGDPRGGEFARPEAAEDAEPDAEAVAAPPEPVEETHAAEPVEPPEPAPEPEAAPPAAPAPRDEPWLEDDDSPAAIVAQP